MTLRTPEEEQAFWNKYQKIMELLHRPSNVNLQNAGQLLHQIIDEQVKRAKELGNGHKNGTKGT